MTLIADPGGQVLYGDWRRRRGTKTDAHLYDLSDPRQIAPGLDDLRPMCGKRIYRNVTMSAPKGRPCTDCLVAEITRRP